MATTKPKPKPDEKPKTEEAPKEAPKPAPKPAPAAEKPKAAKPKVGKKAEKKVEVDPKTLLRALAKYPPGANGLMLASETGYPEPAIHKCLSELCRAHGKEKEPAKVRRTGRLYQLTPAGTKFAMHDLYSVPEKKPPKK